MAVNYYGYDNSVDVDIVKKAKAAIKSRKLKPLRINSTTVIYVKEEKCNEKYAEEYRRKVLRQ